MITRAMLCFAVLAACRGKRANEVGTTAEVLPPLNPAHRYAVLVGIDTQPGTAPPLHGPGEDVGAMRALLTQRYGFLAENVVAIFDTAATRARIIEIFQNVLGRAGSDGLAVFYFSGHGVALDSNYSIHDPEPSGRDQAMYVWGEQGHATIVLDDEIGHLIRHLNTQRVVVIVDACFSGSVATKMARTKSEMRDRLQTADLGSRGLPEVKTFEYHRDMPSFDMPRFFLSDADTADQTGSTAGGGFGALPIHVLLAAVSDSELAHTVPQWPTHDQSRGVFTVFLERAIRTAGPVETFLGLRKRVEDLNHDDPLCTGLYHYCQKPVAGGPDASETLQTVLGPRVR